MKYQNQRRRFRGTVLDRTLSIEIWRFKFTYHKELTKSENPLTVVKMVYKK